MMLTDTLATTYNKGQYLTQPLSEDAGSMIETLYALRLSEINRLIEEGELINASQAGAMLGISQQRVSQLRASGSLSAIEVGPGNYFYVKVEVLKRKEEAPTSGRPRKRKRKDE